MTLDEFQEFVRRGRAAQAAVDALGAGCDHKFVDSRSCLKCGWTPPAADAVREETTEPLVSIRDQR
ncbi:MAG: hypothetical protein ABJA98_01540 [Acidobacteriota bacterium]